MLSNSYFTCYSHILSSLFSGSGHDFISFPLLQRIFGFSRVGRFKTTYNCISFLNRFAWEDLCCSIIIIFTRARDGVRGCVRVCARASERVSISFASHRIILNLNSLFWFFMEMKYNILNKLFVFRYVHGLRGDGFLWEMHKKGKQL